MTMLKQVKNSQKKESGFVMTSELLLLSTVLVIGMVVGLTTMRDAANAEMEDVAEAIGALDQSYAFDGIYNNQLTGLIAGSSFDDAIDTAAGDGTGFTFAEPSNETALLVSGGRTQTETDAGDAGTQAGF